MLAGGEGIDDVAVLRSRAITALFDDTRAPSTVRSWLRAHKWSNVRQLDAISREPLARLWAAGAGPTSSQCLLVGTVGTVLAADLAAVDQALDMTDQGQR